MAIEAITNIALLGEDIFLELVPSEGFNDDVNTDMIDWSSSVLCSLTKLNMLRSSVLFYSGCLLETPKV